MSGEERSPPPPYAPEYGKPPPYYAQPTSGERTVNVATAPSPGWQPPPPPQVVQAQHQQAGHPHAAGPTVVTVTTTPGYITTAQPGQQVLILGNCPSCRIGFLRNEFDICGIIIAILFFPIGILCCLCMMEKRCSHCGARF